jgi:hypothetical protein
MDTMKNQTQHASSYEHKWVKATVVENKDPLNLHRVQIIVSGVVEDAPWAVPDTVNGGGGGGDSTQDIPAIGSKVYVKFQQGKTEFPVYRGAAIEPGTLDSLGGDPNIYGWVRGATTLKVDKTTADITLVCPNFTLHIGPDGSVSMQGGGPLTANFPSATFQIPTSTFTGDVTIQGNQLVQGNATVTKALTANGGFTSNGGTGGTSKVAVFNGPITTNSDLSVGGNLSVTGTGTFGGAVSAPNIH